MQTRRDQLQAYRFQNRRALAALVTGEPNVVEPPMRRLTTTTISGIMIAVLVTVGFALFGFIRPTGGDKWKEPGAVIIEEETGATYILSNGVLHPTLNYASAVLAVTGQRVHIEHVGRGDLKSTERGALIGIRGLPGSLPSKGDLVSLPVAVCSREQISKGDNLTARVSVRLGGDAGARRLPGGTGVIVSAGTEGATYLLLDGRRFAIADAQVSRSLGLQSSDALVVGKAFLNGVPAGGKLKAPTLPGAGTPSKFSVNGSTATVGQLLQIPDGKYYVVLQDGAALVTPVEAALLQTLRIGRGGELRDPVKTSKSDTLDIAPSASWKTIESGQLADLPSQIPDFDRAAQANGGVCAVYGKDSDRPAFAVPPTLIPSYRNPGVSESQDSKQGRADEVTLPPGRAALVKSAEGAPTVFLIDDSGIKFAAKGEEVLTGFGFGDAKPLELPAQVLPLIKTGPALDPSAARLPASG